MKTLATRDSSSLLNGYYGLPKPKQGRWSQYFSNMSLLSSWVLSFIARRAIINIALGPDEVRLQKPIHPVFLSDDRTEKGLVVVNLLHAKSTKTWKSYFNKLPRYTDNTKRQLSFHNPKHKKQIDTIIDEIGLLLEGNSQHDKCQNKIFDIEDLHIKGLERLDTELAAYFENQVCQKYGLEFFKKSRKANLHFYTLETTDNASLESVAISTAEENEKPISERKFLISCMARNQNYMFWLKDFNTSAKNIGCTVIGFNYRGIDYSKGMISTYRNMVDDTLAQAERLLELGVQPENIAFEGMSMGGAVATIAAAKMHDKGLKVNLYNERSYRSFLRLMIGYIMPNANSNPWSPITWSRYILVGLSYAILAPIIYFFGWHLDAASAWDRIPPECKTYSVARNHENPSQYDDDDFLHDSYTSIASLMDQHVAKIKEKQKNGKALSAEEEQILADDPGPHQFTLNRENEINTNPSNHSAPRRFMLDTKTKTQTMHDYMADKLRGMFLFRTPAPVLEPLERSECDSMAPI